MVRAGLLIALVVLIADQASKVAVLDFFARNAVEPVPVTSFFNLVLVWNRGVSFGIMDSAGAGVPWLLSGLALAVVVGLLFWLARADHWLTGTGLGLVIGGALGNVVDRIRFGAVVDFLDFHAAGWHWPAFNLADASIVAGAALLVADGLLASRRQHT